MRLAAVFAALVLLVVVPFWIWGEALERLFSQDGAASWLNSYGEWAWVAGICLLMLDLVLPVPGTAVMAGLGLVYGPVAGGLIAFVGSLASGSLGYLACRIAGRRAARFLLGARELQRGEQLFARAGGWLVVLSRWLPVFPEVIACMAGLTRMPGRTFALALACGSLPLAFAFAAVGHLGAERPALALTLSACAPPVLWVVVQPLFNRVRHAP